MRPCFHTCSRRPEKITTALAQPHVVTQVDNHSAARVQRRAYWQQGPPASKNAVSAETADSARPRPLASSGGGVTSPRAQPSGLPRSASAGSRLRQPFATAALLLRRGTTCASETCLHEQLVSGDPCHEQQTISAQRYIGSRGICCCCAGVRPVPAGRAFRSILSLDSCRPKQPATGACVPGRRPRAALQQPAAGVAAPPRCRPALPHPLLACAASLCICTRQPDMNMRSRNPACLLSRAGAVLPQQHTCVAQGSAWAAAVLM